MEDHDKLGKAHSKLEKAHSSLIEQVKVEEDKKDQVIVLWYGTNVWYFL